MTGAQDSAALLGRPEQEVAVVIPVYKSEMTPYEKVGFDRCLKVLPAYPIVLVAPEGLDLEAYLHPGLALGTHRFLARFFDSIDGYNQLMLSRSFYQSFLEYDFILVYQLDAFVFRDELPKWCAMGFDYIGAPWIGVERLDTRGVRGLPFWPRTRRLRRLIRRLVGARDIVVGNGGFSLRRIRPFLHVLDSCGRRAARWKRNEDKFWPIVAPRCMPSFRIAPPEVALGFSFEIEPRDCFERNGRRVPFGCHAWATYDLDFWRPIFRQHGYVV